MKRTLLLKTILALACTAFSAVAALAADRQIELLNRGVVAVKVADGVYMSWRLLSQDSYTNTAFNIYKNNSLLTTVAATAPTCYTDAAGTASDRYFVRAVTNGVEEPVSCDTVAPWTNSYNNSWKSIPLQRPAGGTMPQNNTTYTYAPGDCSAADLDGDGSYEIIVKWDPSNAGDNMNDGYRANVFIDAYKLDGTFLWRIDMGCNIRAGAHYTQFMVYDFDGDGKAEMFCKTAPGTKDGQGKSVILGSDDPNKDWRGTDGACLDGPEYLTLFDGMTGAEVHSVPFEVARGNVRGNGNLWGDNFGNRSERYLAAVAYLDGIRPSVVMGRGYYARLTMSAWKVVDRKIVKQWVFDSSTPGNGKAAAQGNHNLSVGDVDGDGKDEIIYGACAVNDDGTLMYATGLGHGDAMHLSDLDPNRPGLEVWEVHEEKNSGKWNFEMHDARTGELLFHSTAYSSDNGRGLAADIDPKHRGFEMWSNADRHIYSCKGDTIYPAKPETNTAVLQNFRIYWDGDLQDELYDREKICKWTGGTDGKATNRMATLSTAEWGNGGSINSTKYTPCLQADLIGDWREELLLRGTDNASLVLYTSAIPTTYRVPTLMHDHVYRMGIAWQNVSYNQPPHLGYYLPDFVQNASYNTTAPAHISITIDPRGGTFADNTTAAKTIAAVTGAPIALPAVAREGHLLTGWFLADGTPYCTALYTEDIALHAEWRNVNTFCLTLDVNGGNPIDSAVRWRTAGLPLGTLPTPTGPNSFGGWNTARDGSGTTCTESTVFNVATDVTLYAQWVANAYTLTFDPNGGTVSPQSKTVITDSTVGQLPVPVRPGYAFTEWNERQDGLGLTYTATTVYAQSNHITVYAQWESMPSYTMTFNPNGGTLPEGEATSRTVTVGLPVGALPVPTYAGHEFLGWNSRRNGNGFTYADTTTCTADANFSIYAQWDTLAVTAVAANHAAPLHAYPNPTRGMLYIDIDDDDADNARRVELYTANGARVAGKDIARAQKRIAINIDYLPAGTYFVKVGGRVAKVVKN